MLLRVVYYFITASLINTALIVKVYVSENVQATSKATVRVSPHCTFARHLHQPMLIVCRIYDSFPLLSHSTIPGLNGFENKLV
jgi:hypothetical protein